MEREGKKYEEYAYVLDKLPHGRLGAPRYSYGRCIIQLIGETYFTLLEATPRRDAKIDIGERLYVGRIGRTKVDHILGRISYDELTATAKAELPNIIGRIIEANEKRFIEFFNRSQPVTPKMHALELVPGIGKKLMWQILEERERRPFENFEDLQKRVNIPDPVKLLTRRILRELSEDEKYFLFTRPV